jgi:hypothetical protein
MSGLVSANEQFWRHSTISFGRPSRFPRLRERARPACTRSLSRILSCFAIGARIDHRILEDPAGIEVRLGETAITDTSPTQSEMGEGPKHCALVWSARTTFSGFLTQ